MMEIRVDDVPYNIIPVLLSKSDPATETIIQKLSRT